MSLMDELSQNGISAEDLEKAASVRLFEKAAEVENIDLNQLSEDQVTELYNRWVASDETPVEPAKVASAEEVEEATAKLAEAEYLGRHMARAFVDESEKLAASSNRGRIFMAKTEDPTNMPRRAKELAAQAVADAKSGKIKPGNSRSILTADKRLPYKAQAGIALKRLGRQIGRHKGRAAAVGTGIAALTAAGALGAHMMGKKEGEAPAFDSLVQDQAIALLQANGYTVYEDGTYEKAADAPAETEITLEDAVEVGARELLTSLGFTFEE